MKNETGLIRLQSLKEFSKELLKTLDRNGVNSHQDLQRMLGESFTTTRGFVQLEARPSHEGSIAHVISYIIEGMGVIEVRMNPKFEYSHVTIKSTDEIRGYEIYSMDDFRNYVQVIRFDFSFDEVKRHLEYLAI